MLPCKIMIYLINRWIPVDAAIRSFNAAQYTPEQLKSIILYHVTSNVRYSTAFNPGTIPSQLQGQTVTVAVGFDPVVGHDSLTLNGNAKVVVADTFATSGVIHLIDRVLIPAQFPTVVIPTVTSSNGATVTATGSTTSKSSDIPVKNGGAKVIAGILAGFFGYMLL